MLREHPTRIVARAVQKGISKTQPSRKLVTASTPTLNPLEEKGAQSQIAYGTTSDVDRKRHENVAKRCRNVTKIGIRLI